MTIRALSFDFDRCLFNASYMVSKDILSANSFLLEAIKTENAAFSDIRVFIGSNRQSQKIDEANGLSIPIIDQIGSGSCFPAIKQVSDYLDASLDSFLLADIYGDLPAGLSYERAMDPMYTDDHADYFFDATKATILYAQMHRIAMENPDEEILFDFYDDNADILVELEEFFEKYRELIPTNVSLRMNHYEGDVCTSSEIVNKGTGIIDANYRQTVKDMAQITRTAIEDSAELKHAEASTAKYVQPHFLTNRQPFYVTPEQENLRAQLRGWYQKEQVLRNNGHTVAADHALKLRRTININSSKFFHGEIDIPEFRKICTDAIDIARPELTNHRGWKEILGNLGLALIGLGIGYIAAGLYKWATTGDFLLFRPETDSVKRLDHLQNMLEQVSNSPAA